MYTQDNEAVLSMQLTIWAFAKPQWSEQSSASPFWYSDVYVHSAALHGDTVATERTYYSETFVYCAFLMPCATPLHGQYITPNV